MPIVPTVVVENIEELQYLKTGNRLCLLSKREDTGCIPADQQGIRAASAAILNQGKTAMLQEYLSSVEEYGERSSVLIAGKITFTMKKTPKSGDFLVHTHHGGTYIPVKTTLEEQQFLELLISKIGEAPLYMRVDYLRRKDGLICLLELEQIEPNLYLRENGRAELLTQGNPEEDLI